MVLGEEALFFELGCASNYLYLELWKKLIMIQEVWKAESAFLPSSQAMPMLLAYVVREVLPGSSRNRKKLRFSVKGLL